MVLHSRVPTESKRDPLDRHSDGSQIILTIAMIACLVFISGCSGIVTESMTGNLLADRSILPLENSIDQPALDTGPEKTLEDLTQDTEIESDSGLVADQNASANSNKQKASGFHFSQELPAEPVFGGDFTAPEENAESPDLETARPEITLVARTQPIEATNIADVQPIKTEFEAVVANGAKILSPLQPVISMSEMPDTKIMTKVDIAATMPKLSSADLRQVTRSAVDIPLMSTHETLDLTELEFESNLLTGKPKTEPNTVTNHLSKTIQLLKESAKDVAVIDGYPGLNVSVQMLEMLQQKLDDPSISEWSISVEEQEYWQQQLQAVAVMFEADAEQPHSSPNHQRQKTAIRAIEHLDKASYQLRKMAGLRIRGGQLCSEILGYGQYQELGSSQFQPGDRALAYVEVENYSSQQLTSVVSSGSENGSQWVTQLQTGYKILDSTGRVVQQKIYPVIEDIAHQRRRDFYLHLPLTIANLPAGDYQLTIKVEDLGNSTSSTLQDVAFSVTN